MNFKRKCVIENSLKGDCFTIVDYLSTPAIRNNEDDTNSDMIDLYTCAV